MPNNIAKILEFMKVLDKVCLIKRATLLSDGTTETDSSHSFKLAWLLMMIYPYLKHKYNYTRLLELALVHDIAEAETGDCPKSVQRAHPEMKKLKDQQEAEAMQKYRDLLPSELGGRIYDLWREYEDKKTPESRLVTALDKIDANLQANQHKNGDVRYWLECEDGSQYLTINTEKKQVVAVLNEPIVEDLENAVIALSLENLRKCGIKI
ncbi:MAG: HD domain-containing protein [Alphaproteobacteria bacterium]|nr:HD domain-containing protein [Alphaproteobacteria bacterium]